MWQYNDGGDWVWMTVAMAFVWVPIVLIALWALGRGLTGTNDVRAAGDQQHTEDDPQAVARRAYAHGDLTRERFLEIVDDLDQTRRLPAH